MNDQVKLCCCGHSSAEHDSGGVCQIRGEPGFDWRCPCPGFTEAHGLTALQRKVLMTLADYAPHAGEFVDASMIQRALPKPGEPLNDLPTASAVGRSLGVLALRGLAEREDTGYYHRWRTAQPSNWQPS